MERRLDAALRIHARRSVAPQLEREYAGDVAGKGDRLQVVHQADVLFERIGDADGRAGQLTLFTAGVVRFDLLDAPLDLANVLEILVQPRAIARSELAPQLGDFGGHPIEDAFVGPPVRCTLLGRGADAKQHVERGARIAHHRQRLGWRCPADRVGVDARIAVSAAA
jgi:hypothetical protein